VRIRWREVFTAMAAALGAPTPRHLPGWAFRLMAPYVATFAVDTSMPVSAWATALRRPYRLVTPGWGHR